MLLLLLAEYGTGFVLAVAASSPPSRFSRFYVSLLGKGDYERRRAETRAKSFLTSTANFYFGMR